jgi:hypothetical protein
VYLLLALTCPSESLNAFSNAVIESMYLDRTDRSLVTFDDLLQP